MAVPADGVTRWFRDSNGKISQIDHVLQITITSPLVAQDTYRDSPPIVVGGAAGAAIGSADAVIQASIAGGVQPTVSTSATSVEASGASSVLQDDTFTHVAPRILWGPLALVFFRTKDGPGPALNPTNATFPIAPPSGGGAHFDAFDIDCVFSWGEDCAIFNTAPPGWSVGQSVAT